MCGYYITYKNSTLESSWFDNQKTHKRNYAKERNEKNTK